MNRRKFIDRFIAIVSIMPFAKTFAWSSNPDSCKTGADTAGPFHRKNAPFRHKLNANYKGDGEKLKVSGIVYGADCKTALENAVVDIWHASPEGKYDETSSDFQFRGQIKTNKNGCYEYHTLLPAAYTDAGLDRPKHIHYKVRAEGYNELTTQLYFEGDERLADDYFVKKNDGMKRVRPLKNTKGGLQVTFDIYLTK